VKWQWRRKAAQSPEPSESAVRGDRGRSWVSQVPSIYSRLSSILTLALMLVIGTGLLAWYYTHAALRPSRVRGTARAALERSAQEEMTLPPLERVAAPPRTYVPDVDATPLHVESAAVPGSPYSDSTAAAGTPEPVPHPVSGDANAEVLSARFHRTAVARPAIDRRLTGPVYAVEAARRTGELASSTPVTDAMASMGASGTAVGAAPAFEQATPTFAGNGAGRPAAGADLSFAALLRSEPAAAVQATVLTTQRLLLPKGAFIDCTLETAIDSTLPGMTTCVTATDTFGVDGKVVLLERGTKLVGETRGQVQQGSARVFVIWTQARTPTGVVVPLESPGTDELGRSGLTGEVDRHFWDRFGAAIMISTIDGVVQSAIESGSRNGATTIINPTSAQDVMTETLKGTLNIPPTIIKHNGDRIQILVARDIDFRGVYELRPVADAR
jgi:type IV secretion system protein VirB10